jgi:hypothetical protein
LEFKMVGVVIVIVAGLDASSQGKAYGECENCFLHVDFLLRFAHRDGMCAQKVSRNRGALH